METNYQENILILIARNLNGIAELDEVFQLNVWLESSDENRKYYDQVKNIWDVSDNRMDYGNINESKALKDTLKRIKLAPVRENFWFLLQKVAAILFIPLLIGSLLWISSVTSSKNRISNEVVYNEVHAAFGTRSQLRLSDSSLVWLNSGSTLRYPVKFENNQRKVFLSGEAYFEVESDESKPFIVETPTLQIKATGTKFNVQEYYAHPVSEVMLLSGKITVNECNNSSEDNSSISELKPNQFLSYNRETREKHIINEDVLRYVAWKDGRLVFRNDPLERVLAKLSLMFNVEIDLQGDQLKNYRYHATFQDESLEEILKLLKLSAPLNFREIKRSPLPDGSFPKKKVIIFFDKSRVYV